MNRTPRALLKGASSILAEGSSLTSNGVEYESSEAKDAIKGFVRDAKLKKADESAPPAVEVVLNPVPKNEIPDRLPIETKSVQMPSNTRHVKSNRNQESDWDYFVIYLVILNLFLFGGIIVSALSAVLVAYASKNNLSSLSPALVLASFAESVYLSALELRGNLFRYIVDFDLSIFLQDAMYCAVGLSANVKSLAEYLFSAACRSASDIYSNFPEYADDFVNSSLDYFAILYDDSVGVLKSMFPN